MTQITEVMKAVRLKTFRTQREEVMTSKVSPTTNYLKQTDTMEGEIREIVFELDCGYCETNHDHDESRNEGIKKLLNLLSQAKSEGVEEALGMVRITISELRDNSTDEQVKGIGMWNHALDCLLLELSKPL